jgi:fructose-specific component phosphotransferase system IIB-like protein
MLDQWPPKDPGEVKDYDINWLPELGTDTIIASIWAIVSGTGLTINTNSFTTTRTKVWLSGGTLGQTYLLKNTITTAAGDTEIETATLGIKANPAIVVEDGTGLPNANSYASASTLITYCNDRAITLPAGNLSGALIRATQYIEGNYRGRWAGSRTKYRGLQSLSWPRFGAYVSDGSRIDYRTMQLPGVYSDVGYAPQVYYIQPNEIPVELVQATCEAAIRELAVPGYLQPDLTVHDIKKESAGDTSFEYFNGYASMPLVTVIEGILSGLLLSRTDLFGVRDRMS